MAKKAAGMIHANKEWQAQCDLDTLMEAKAIQKDKSRLKAAIACGKEKMDKLNKALVEAEDD